MEDDASRVRQLTLSVPRIEAMRSCELVHIAQTVANDFPLLVAYRPPISVARQELIPRAMQVKTYRRVCTYAVFPAKVAHPEPDLIARKDVLGCRLEEAAKLEPGGIDA